MKNKKIIIAVVACVVALAVIVTAACIALSGPKDGGGSSSSSNLLSSTKEPLELDLDYDKNFLSEKEDVISGYNSNLFYVNTLDFEIADPTVIQITEGEEKGYFYVYGTSDEIGCHGFQAWRSKDLSRWECMGVALQPDYEQTWAVNNYWAPEIIYDAGDPNDPDDGMYYLFYNAYNRFDNNMLYLSVACSQSPKGPFVSPNGMFDANGNMLSISKPVYDFTTNNPAINRLVDVGENFVKQQVLDASPFIDPETGKKYMYFSYYDNYGIGSFIYGVEMIDWFTPKYSTLTQLTVPGYRSVQAKQESNTDLTVREGGVNEGPFMVYRNGKYYLTISIFGYTDPAYHVIQAISDHPLGRKNDPTGHYGDFIKIDELDGGVVVESDTVNWSHITSAGHHCFFRCGDELFIGYHTFKNRIDISGGRALAVDKVVWTTNSEGVEVMHTNGPTYSVQALPESVSGYKNIAPSATVTANNTSNNSNVSLLNDEIIKYREPDLAEEYHAKEGTSVIKLSWDKFKTVRGIMIFNSYEYEKTFVSIDKVVFNVKTVDGEQKITINNLEFDWDWHFEADWELMRPGGAAIAEFYEMPVNSIEITVTSPEGSDYLALGEIIVLGKDSECAALASCEPYTYQISSIGSPHIVREGAKIGSIAGTRLKTTWGYDTSLDDGTSNACIKQLGVAEQYAYFKDVYSTSFYVEAQFTVTNQKKAFAGLNEHMDGDPYPKFGLVASCVGDYNNTLFYYVDAVGYTTQRVGVAQQNMAGTDWDWAATERLVDVAGLNYTKGNYVTLAILRVEEKFFFICNGRVVIEYSSFNIFDNDQAAGVGFLTFNTGLNIKNYSATSDSQVIAQKASEYGIKLNG